MPGKRGSRTEKKGEKAIKACKLFFPEGGEDEVRKLLTDAVGKAREKAGIDRAVLDKICCFKEDGLPSSAEFEEKPSLMTHRVFCRAACVLDLKIDEVLSIDCSGAKLEAIVEAMDSSNAGLAAALAVGRTKRQPIANEQIAPVFAAFKILSEI